VWDKWGKGGMHELSEKGEGLAARVAPIRVRLGVGRGGGGTMKDEGIKELFARTSFERRPRNHWHRKRFLYKSKSTRDQLGDFLRI